jgi:hypothetical protein
MGICRLRLEGKLDRDSLESAFQGVETTMGDGCSLLVDCLNMTGYENEARDRFVEWNKANRAKLQRVAIVTDKPLWRMVASTIALATRQDMKVFSAAGDAEAWLTAE